MIPPRTKFPKPDPQESFLLSKRQTVPNAETLWLPDSTPAAGVPELPLAPEDHLNPADFKPCPPVAQQRSEIAKCAEAIANWTFATYCGLVYHRLEVYNKYRRQYNQSVELGKTLGQYRHACRLAVEQIVRRDLPYIHGLEWNYWQPSLSVVEMALGIVHNTDINSVDYETVSKISIQCVVEVRQHNESPASFTLTTVAYDEPEWSSSSSSSSWSDFDPS